MLIIVSIYAKWYIKAHVKWLQSEKKLEPHATGKKSNLVSMWKIKIEISEFYAFTKSLSSRQNISELTLSSTDNTSFKH